MLPYLAGFVYLRKVYSAGEEFFVVLEKEGDAAIKSYVHRSQIS
jgi:hypothetical protein